MPLKTEVSLIGSKTDLYGRTVAEVINNKGVNTNKKMAELGLVVWYKFQKGCDDYKDIEAKAKKTKTGVWNDPAFEMPWDYRTRMGIGFRGTKNFTMSHNKDQNSNSATGSTPTKMTSYQKHATSQYSSYKSGKSTNAWFPAPKSSSSSSSLAHNTTSHYNLRTRVKKLFQ